MTFFFVHGVFGSPEGNWFPELKQKLESLGQTVIAPQFPIDDEAKLTKDGPHDQKLQQTLDNWLAVFDTEFRNIPKNEKLCFIGHSLGCLFILRAVEKYKIQLDSAIFAGPFLDCLPTDVWPYTGIIPNFQKTDFDSVELKKLIPISYVLYSDTDPYVPNRQSLLFASVVGSSLIQVRDAGHMNMEVNLDEFNLVLDLCLTRLDLSYTLKYKFLKQKYGAFDFITSGKRKGSVTFDNPKQDLDDKVVRWENIRETGFATLFTGLKGFQLPHSIYMEGARHAAKRMKRFDRVILVDAIKDLRDPDWYEQIRADIDAGIHIYLCMYQPIKNIVPEPDFGLWDERYAVTDEYNPKTHTVTNMIVSSTPDILHKTRKWKTEVMKHAVEVKNAEKDVKQYIHDHTQ